MDNFNALSKSAILTKLALDGYFIDLLTLNSFIKDWQIEAIYENEFGIEFFDNNSYLTILDKLKDKYNKAKSNIGQTPVQSAANYEEQTPDIKNETIENAAETALTPEQTNNNEEGEQQIQDEIQAQNETQSQNEAEYGAVSLEDLAEESKREFENETAANEKEDLAGNETSNKYEESNECEETILPAAMKYLKPGPVSPNSNINVDHSYIPPESDTLQQESKVQSLSPEDGAKVVDTSCEANLDSFIEEENFSEDEIEKANNLINAANTKTQNPLPESITETYIDIKPKEVPSEDSIQTKEDVSKKENKGDELDLVQLAQSFAQNFTGGDTKEVPAADLEQIFTESYTEPFSELQDYVKDEPEEYKSLQEDLPSDIIPETPKETIQSDTPPVSSSTSNLSADDVRSIIREEIARQTASIVPVPQNNENLREILREIVKQTADVVPQNAFKLDISQGTLDMIAKTIAKKIAIKLNNYYKLNSKEQNTKLQLFRTRTIELKEKNQMLAEENKKLKERLLESNSELNSYKKTIFGLYKFVGRKRR